MEIEMIAYKIGANIDDDLYVYNGVVLVTQMLIQPT
jgi:hypothetical protein